MSNFHITITGGKYKGKKLHSASLDTTRSTKAILKGSLFDTLQFEIVGQNFVEVFGGSGSIGLEAISRGAKMAYFIERDKHAFSILEKNCNLIDKDKSIAYFGDSFDIYPTIVNSLEKDSKKAYIYFDPPFDIRDGMDGIYEKVFSLIESTPKSIVLMIIIEHATKTKIPDVIGEFSKKKSKKFGKSSLSYFTFDSTIYHHS